MKSHRRPSRRVLTALVTTLLLAFEARVEADTYYVATTGSDSNPGTEQAPFLTLGKAADTAQAGDTVIMRGGQYGGFQRNTLNGAEGAPITFRASPGERVTLDRYLNPARSCSVIQFINNASHLIFDGFELVNTHPTLARMRALDLENPGARAEYIRLREELSGTGQYCNFAIRSNSTSHHLTFQNLEIHHDGIAFSGGFDSSQFLNNHLYEISYGWYINGDQNVFQGNHIHNAVFGFHLRTGITRSVFEANLIHHNGGKARLDFTDDPPNLQHDGTGFWIRGPSSDNIIRNNIIFKNGPRGGYGGISITTGSGNKVYNNTLVENNVGIHVGGSNVAIRNNILYGNGMAITTSGGSADESNNLTADPRFVNAGGTVPDFHVMEGSPAIDQGIALAEVPCDADGNERPHGTRYDIGAYESGSTPAASCPRTGVVRPSEPMPTDGGVPQPAIDGGPPDTGPERSMETPARDAATRREEEPKVGGGCRIGGWGNGTTTTATLSILLLVLGAVALRQHARRRASRSP